MDFKEENKEQLLNVELENLIQQFGVNDLIVCNNGIHYIDINTGETGDSMEFLTKKCNMSIEEAFEYLNRQNAITNHDNKIKDSTWLYQINKDTMLFYQKQLKNESLQYVKDRGLTNYNIKKFNIGFAGEYGNSLYTHLKEKGYTEEQMLIAGLVSKSKENEFFDRFWMRIMYPIFDIDKNVVGFGGRTIDGNKAKYMNSIETPVFDKSRLLYGMHIASKSRKKYLIACEGYMDVIAFHQQGFSNAVASLGTALTLEHVKLMKKYADTIYLAYDSDLPGRKATSKAVDLIESQEMKIKIINLKPWKDPDEFAKNEGKEALEKRIKEASEEKKWKIKASVLDKNNENYVNNVIDIILKNIDEKN